MIYIASDHAGFDLKKAIIEHLKEKGAEVEDCGAHEYDENDDYPDFIYPCAKKVAENPGSLGVIMGGSGQGEAMVANKAKGIRATEYYGGNLDIVKLSKTHNDANVLSFGARFVTPEQAIEALDLWLATKYDSSERHERRHKKIREIESKG
ncbi:RpiB/LacA/LacB family sugar-phosphate isomerase [Candidatus Curtissbacteria bacterium]|nr:RpiB/LacA/LacB family sugar-phosphate isomerase [Candidatus Curtissbacteria bacterium]